jgi:uncharacterized protein (TIGR02569 family)
MSEPQPPSTSALEAFGIIDTKLESLPGGRGLCFRAGNIVLRPAEDDREAQWIAQFVSNLQAKCSPIAYRLPAPIATKYDPGAFIHEGWTASYYLEGEARQALNFADLLALCRAFHRDVAELGAVKPPFLDGRTSRFHLADRVTWGELDLCSIEKLNMSVLARIKDDLQRIELLRRPLSEAVYTSQIIHGDITGNVLFSSTPGVPPGIIDITPYWRPAAYAEAIIVADALFLHGKGREVIEELGTDSFRLQLLVRALYWRCVTFAIDSHMPFVNAVLPKTNFSAAAAIVQVMVHESDNHVPPPKGEPQSRD